MVSQLECYICEYSLVAPFPNYSPLQSTLGQGSRQATQAMHSSRYLAGLRDSTTVHLAHTLKHTFDTHQHAASQFGVQARNIRVHPCGSWIERPSKECGTWVRNTAARAARLCRRQSTDKTICFSGKSPSSSWFERPSQGFPSYSGCRVVEVSPRTQQCVLVPRALIFLNLVSTFGFKARKSHAKQACLVRNCAPASARRVEVIPCGMHPRFCHVYQG
jgi:hypothetical protein